MITITDSAKNQIKKLSNYDPPYIRFGVRGGGCHGFVYVFEFTEPSSESLEINGIKVIIDPKSVPYITGTILDFTPAIRGYGFKIDNPNTTSSCGCKESISF